MGRNRKRTTISTLIRHVIRKKQNAKKHSLVALGLVALASAPTDEALAQGRATLSGHITEMVSKETIIGATAIDSQTRQGTVSNSFGFYSLTLPTGRHTVDFSYVGYEHVTLQLDLTKDTVVNISMSENSKLDEITVTATRDDAGVASTGMGSMDVPLKMIEHTPSLLGETDIIKTIQLTPGVQQGTGGSAAFYVRGGDGDANLILLDGAPVYKIDHLFGFFSVFTPEAVKKVTFYKSSFPARYNGRTSSVIDVRTKDGNMSEYHASLSIGLLTSRFNIEGPIVKDKTSFNISARSTYFSLIAKPFMEDNEKFGYWFYDLNAKVNHKFSDNDRLYVGVYNGMDKMDSEYEDEYGYYKNSYSGHNNVTNDYGSDTQWGNTIATLRWNHIFSQRLFCNVSGSYNHYRMKLSSYDNYLESETGNYDESSSSYHSEIVDWGASADFDYMPHPAHSVKFGASYLYHDFEPETSNSQWKTKEGQDKTDDNFSSKGKSIYAHEMALYGEDEWRFADRLRMDVGLALTLFCVQDKAYGNAQPRISAKYLFSDDWSAKASFSQMSQCVHLLQSMPIALPTDIWVPITKNIKPEKARQVSLGGYFTGAKDWEFSLEGYYKVMDNVIEYKDGMSYMGFSGSWSDMVSMGKGYSRGLEVMARRVAGKATGWVAYTLSKSDRKFSKDSGVNNGERFPFTYDRRHNVNVVFSFEVADNVELDASWSFMTGACATIANSYMKYIMPDGTTSSAPYVTSRNNFRLPYSHFLNLGINVHKHKKHYERIWNFSVYNLYNHMNPNFVYYSNNQYSMENKQRLTKVTILPIIPSATLTIRF